MKKILLPLVFCYQILIANESEKPDVDKGQLVYKYFVSPFLKINGTVFTKLYTKKEWEDKFLENGKKFMEEFKIKNNTINKDDLIHLKEFSIYYAKDSDVSANCGE